MKVEVPQTSHKLGDIDHNLKLMKDALSKSSADLLVYPELFLSGYSCRDALPDVALPIDGDKIKELQETAKAEGRALIFGMPEAHPEIRDLIHNSAVFINKQGDVDVYRKLHLVNFGPFEEKTYFTPGTEVRIMELDGCRFGIIICYDVYFPELTKLYALQGADLIVHISASPSATKVFFQKMMVARAVENTTFFIYSNLLGTEKNMVFWGGSTVVGPRGEIKSQAKEYEEDNIVFDIDLSELKVARQNRPTLRDTRFELFEALKRIGEIKFDSGKED